MWRKPLALLACALMISLTAACGGDDSGSADINDSESSDSSGNKSSTAKKSTSSSTKTRAPTTSSSRDKDDAQEDDARDDDARDDDARDDAKADDGKDNDAKRRDSDPTRPSTCDVSKVGGKRFCAAPGCPCDEGEGDCDNDTECQSGLHCVHKIGKRFGFGDIDVCVKLPFTPEKNPECSKAKPNGHPDKCSKKCPCGQYEGDCDKDAACLPGLICSKNVGSTYGYRSKVDVCVPPPA